MINTLRKLSANSRILAGKPTAGSTAFSAYKFLILFDRYKL